MKAIPTCSTSTPPTPLGRLTLFHYALDLETGPEAARDTTFSSRTTGARLVGRRHWGDLGLVWEGSYARQTDFADNPLDYAADYWLAALTAEYRRATVTVRAETLGGDDEQAFQTPLATVHRFQGDADVFMMTPQVGIRDLSAGLEWRFGDVGPLRAVTARLRGHVFDADQGGGDIGREIDAEVSARYGRTTFSAAYADFAGAGPFADVRRLFLTIAHAF